MEKLFVYGSLAPNRPNKHMFSEMGSSFSPTSIKGYLKAEGWGMALGSSGLITDETGKTIEGWVFVSDALAAHGQRLDKFEGDGYRRIQVMCNSPTAAKRQFGYVP